MTIAAIYVTYVYITYIHVQYIISSKNVYIICGSAHTMQRRRRRRRLSEVVYIRLLRMRSGPHSDPRPDSSYLRGSSAEGTTRSTHTWSGTRTYSIADGSAHTSCCADTPHTRAHTRRQAHTQHAHTHRTAAGDTEAPCIIHTYIVADRRQLCAERYAVSIRKWLRSRRTATTTPTDWTV